METAKSSETGGQSPVVELGSPTDGPETGTGRTTGGPMSAQDELSQENVIIPGEEVIIEGPSFGRSIRILLWKDYQQFYQRRKKLFFCRLCCPVILILILALTRLFFWPYSEPDSLMDLNTGDNDLDLYVSPDPTDVNSFASDVLCLYDDWHDLDVPAALAIIPSPDDCGDLSEAACAHFRAFADILNQTWNMYSWELDNNLDDDRCYYTIRSIEWDYEWGTWAACSDDDSDDNQANNTGTDDWMDYDYSYWWEDDEYYEVVNVSQTHWDIYGCWDSVERLQWKEGELLRFFASNDELNEYTDKSDYGQGYNWNDAPGTDEYDRRPIGAAIVINSISDDGVQWDYTLRLNSSNTPSTSGNPINTLSREGWVQHDYSAGEYTWGGFSSMQEWIDKSISYYVAELTGKQNSSYATYLDATEAPQETLQRLGIDKYGLVDRLYLYNWHFPVPAYTRDWFWLIMGYTFIFFVMLMFLYPINLNVSALVDEKAARITESLKQMGSGKTAYWLSWLIWFGFEQTVIAIGVSIIGCLTLVFRYSDMSIIFIWMWGFCMAMTGMSTLLSTLFDNPKVASLVGIFVWIITLFSGYFAVNMTSAAKGWMCLLAPACLTISLTNLTEYESNGFGMQPFNIYDEYEGFAFATAISMFWVDYFLYLVLALYLDHVWPSRYGARFVPWFCILPSFWKGGEKVEDEEMIKEMQMNGEGGKSIYDGPTFEDVSQKYQNLEPSIKIRNLHKVYLGSVLEGKNRVVRAVNGIDLDIYEGECFCLLGHNGAGKTTTVDMLSGMTTVTGGDAWILGNHVVNGMQEIRKTLGVCPQHNILFSKLTVEQHLYLYCSLKGIAKHQVSAEVQKTIDKIGLRDKNRAFPHELSGGQKRKLALGIAFIGDSKILFLDEPTSGMDPQARRVIWDMITKEKKNKTIVLTTHFMDEADHLGDRIAIMANGKVHCCGSPLFLKRVYGVGYTFTVSLNIGVKYEEVKKPIDGIIEKHVGDAQMLSVAGGEINYRLPFQNSAAFAPMFEDFDNFEINRFHPVNSYGISVTTLEEVFLKIGLSEHPVAAGASPGASGDGAGAGALSVPALGVADESVGAAEMEYKDSSPGISELKQGLAGPEGSDPFAQPEFKLGISENANHFQRVTYEVYVFFLHAWCVLYRRFWWQLRDFRSILCQVVMPCIIATVGLAVIDLVVQGKNPLLELDVTQWHDVQHVKVPIANTSLSDVASNYSNVLIEEYGPWIAGESGYNELVSGEFGALRTYEYNSSLWVENGTYFSQLLLDEVSKHKYTPYHGFYPNPLTYNAIGVGFNLSAYHSKPIARNAMRNWILKTQFDEDASIKISNWPLKETKTEAALTSNTVGIFAAIFIVMAFVFVPVGSIYQIVFERSESNTKHQQFVSGMSMLSYWFGNYLFDVLVATPAAILVIIIVDAFDTDSFSGNYQVTRALLLSLYAFIWDVMPYTYMLSFLFRQPSSAQRWVGILYIILGQVLFILYELAVNSNFDTWYFLFSLFPPFSLAMAVFGIANKPDDKGYLDYGVCGKHLEHMFWFGFFWLFCVLAIEYLSHSPAVLMRLGLIPNTGKRVLELDPDVARERARVQRMLDDKGAERDTVLIAGLRKVYQQGSICGDGVQNVAVRDLWFGVPQGQVFGFLGVNGAGKTSALAMLTGERHPSEGIAYINGYPITNQSMVRRFVGYCPQFDALFDLLTGEEHLYFYGKLKGLSRKEIKKQTEILLKVLNLTKYAKKQSMTYSGGNKRKLSVAISMIGNPPVVFLDEPSTGMDPVSRRQMWDFISSTMAGRSVILTTHSMEECQALCHRLAIMVKGQLKCIGTPQHLKSRFGNGYQFDVTLEDGKDATRLAVENALSRTFDFKRLETNSEKATYELEVREEYVERHGKFTLAKLFKELEQLKESQPIVSYAVNQTTLEQVFLRMAREKADLLQSQLGKTERENIRLKAELERAKAEIMRLKALLAAKGIDDGGGVLQVSPQFAQDAQSAPAAQAQQVAMVPVEVEDAAPAFQASMDGSGQVTHS